MGWSRLRPSRVRSSWPVRLPPAPVTSEAMSTSSATSTRASPPSATSITYGATRTGSASSPLVRIAGSNARTGSFSPVAFPWRGRVFSGRALGAPLRSAPEAAK